MKKKRKQSFVIDESSIPKSFQGILPNKKQMPPPPNNWKKKEVEK